MLFPLVAWSIYGFAIAIQPGWGAEIPTDSRLTKPLTLTNDLGLLHRWGK